MHIFPSCNRLVLEEVVSLDLLLPSCFLELQKRQLLLTSWEQTLMSAQNVLFNEELFAQVRHVCFALYFLSLTLLQLAKEAFDQRSDLQGEVLTDRINVPVR